MTGFQKGLTTVAGFGFRSSLYGVSGKNEGPVLALQNTDSLVVFGAPLCPEIPMKGFDI